MIATESRLSCRAIALIFLGVFVLLLGRSVNRNLDPDEHQFVAPPALLVQDHLLPYVDYPYFHMPNLVFIYAALTGWTSYKLLAARVVMTMCGTGTVVLLIVAAWNAAVGLTARMRWAFAGGMGVLFVCCRMFFYTDGWAWNHDMPVLCAVAAFLLQVRGMRRGKIGPIVVAGFLLGMAMGIRLSFALAPIPFLVSVMFGESSLTRRQRGVALGLGMFAAVLAVSPAIWFLFRSPERFFFGNLGYPALSTQFYRSIHYDHGMMLVGKIGVMIEKFVLDPGNLVLLILFLVSSSFLWRRGSGRRGEVLLLGGLLFCLLIGTLGPTPIQPQYCYMLVPFMVLMIGYGVARLVQIDLGKATLLVKAIGWMAVVVGAIMLPAQYWRVIYLVTPSRWTPVQQHRRAEWIREMLGAHARVLTTETTVPLEAGLEVYPEYAVGRFVLLVAKFQSPVDRAKYGMVSMAELSPLLEERPPDGVFVRSTPELEKWALEHRYQPAKYDSEYTLWVRPRVMPYNESR